MVAARRLGFGILPLLFLAGTIVMLFLLILAGAYDRRPLNQIFFLQADTRGIPDAPNGISHWTLYNVCNGESGRNHDCRPAAAFPLLPQGNFGTRQNIPKDFLDHPGRYFYLSRFLFAFYLIDVILALAAFVACALGPFSNAAAGLSGLALFFVTFSATIMTYDIPRPRRGHEGRIADTEGVVRVGPGSSACYVLGQNAFRNSGRFARVGVKAFAFTWTCVALLFLTTVFLSLARLSDRRRRVETEAEERYPVLGRRVRDSEASYYADAPGTGGDGERYSKERPGSGRRAAAVL